jgi:tetratricopeptide (TPR) repeat protein
MTWLCTFRPISRALPFAMIVLALAGVGLCIYEAEHPLRPNVPSVQTAMRIAKNQTPKQTEESKILSKASSVSYVGSRQRDLVKSLLAQRQYDTALAAAKQYYEVAELAKTRDAVKVLTAALGRARGKATAEEFERQQLANLKSTSLNDEGMVADAVLWPIKCDAAEYDNAIERLENDPEDFSAMMGCGNLLLLQDKVLEARDCFEFALQYALGERPEKPQRTVAALEGVARTIRDEDGCARQADAFILGLRLNNDPDSSGDRGDAPSDRVRAAAIKIATSGIFDGDPNLAECSTPEDPSNKAARDLKLASWLARWQSTRYRRDFADTSEADLLDMLKGTTLSAATLLSVGRSISYRSADDWVAAAFYAAGALKCHEELTSLTSNGITMRHLIVAMTFAKLTLWNVVDGGDKTFVVALYILNRDLADHIPTEDAKLRNARVHGFVGAAECLWLDGRFPEAQETLSQLGKMQLTIEQKRAVAWIQGLIFLSTDRYSDAATQFQTIVNAPKFLYTENAWRWLAVCLARTGKIAEANRAFDEWVRAYRPDVKLAARVLELMDNRMPPT